MGNVEDAIQELTKELSNQELGKPIPFQEFLEQAAANPKIVFRNIFQLFYDMIHHYISIRPEDHDKDPELMDFIDYDFTELLVTGIDEPFFADRLFANRLVREVSSFRQSAQQNKVYLIEGPPGSGKSVFLNSLLQRFEEYSNTLEGAFYETIWKLDVKKFDGFPDEDLYSTVPFGSNFAPPGMRQQKLHRPEEILEVPCPSHDHPILQIPKTHRKIFLEELVVDEAFKERLFHAKEYEWVLKDGPCPICKSLYRTLLEKSDFSEILGMLYAKRYSFNRMMGEGISIFNSSDPLPKRDVMTDEILQNLLNNLLRASNKVPYFFSQLAKTNNGVYALMDVKSYNAARFKDLHGIITDGVHKVGNIEESVNSLFMGVANPEDRKEFKDMKSFEDRIVWVPCNYVLNYETEKDIYRNVFGENIEESFLPGILDIFTRIVLSTRLNRESKQIQSWINETDKYKGYCDKNLLLLKMELYTGKVPAWLAEEDRRTLTLRTKKRILNESLAEGKKGFSGRESIKIFEEFFSKYSRSENLITTQDVYEFFIGIGSPYKGKLAEEFVNSVVRLYDQEILEQIKESLYDYDEEQISRDVQNYLWAVVYKEGAEIVCRYTGEKILVTEGFFDRIEGRIIGQDEPDDRRHNFREAIRGEYATITLVKEIGVEEKEITETNLYGSLYFMYLHNLKRNVLEPFLKSDNFARAVREHDTPFFKSHDKRLRKDVEFLLKNLQEKFNYTKEGAQQVVIYVLDKGLAHSPLFDW